jgi:competence protein ComEC
MVSLIIWLLTMPLCMARFHLFTPVGVLLNTVLWLPMAAALICGFGVLVFGWLLPPVATVFAFGCDQSLALLEWCIDAGAAVPGGCFWVPGPAGWWLAGFYGALALWAAVPALRPPRRWFVALAAGWAGVGFLVPMLSSDRAELDCTILSVGHGSAVVLGLPSGATILYDAGQFASPDYGARSIAACLWSRGVTHLDAVVLSHSDLDHYNAIPELLERFSVGVIYVSPVMFEEENQAMAALAESIRRAGVPVETISAGDRLVVSGRRTSPTSPVTLDSARILSYSALAWRWGFSA